MTTIKANCPVCGEVSLTPADIELWVDSTGLGPSSYAFECPSCGDHVRKPADERVVRLLVSGGVDPQEPRPEYAPTLGERFEAPQLTHDDLLDLHGLLERDDWFDQLLSATHDRR